MWPQLPFASKGWELLMPAKGGQKKSAQKCSHAGEKLKVQAQRKDKHVLMTPHRETVEDTLETQPWWA